MSDNTRSTPEEVLSKFIPHLDSPDFDGAIIVKSYRTLYKSNSLMDKIFKFFKDNKYDFTIYRNSGMFVFESGARIHLSRVDNINGLLLDAALVIIDEGIATTDINVVKSRLWNSKEAIDNIWFINDYNL